eukprot:CAMPEP_0172447372 /NCGR_PEP_ID=MMETSP1065-20121228/6691_1 /TAXON_ID=265537 /ORGANISM="Amphiprora paludosa, Strain CCMP125" /LENGTH=994 /DNA_ID=CAMNT_0013198659 /DNA_START=55 /DNA_END=3039 /DNA_ORIENTATION=+
MESREENASSSTSGGSSRVLDVDAMSSSDSSEQGNQNEGHNDRMVPDVVGSHGAKTGAYISSSNGGEDSEDVVNLCDEPQPSEDSDNEVLFLMTKDCNNKVIDSADNPRKKPTKRRLNQTKKLAAKSAPPTRTENSDENKQPYGFASADIRKTQVSQDSKNAASKRKQPPKRKRSNDGSIQSGPKKTKSKDNDAVTSKTRLPAVKDKVYARWPENDEWYFGRITSMSAAKDFFDVKFEDGDSRCAVPRKELVFAWEPNYQGLFAEAQQRRKTPGRKKAPPKSTKQKKTDTTTKPATSASTANAKDSGMHVVEVGKRCYAKFTDGLWYWGTITKVEGKGANITCSVEYTDGDVRENIPKMTELRLESECNSSEQEQSDNYFAELQGLRCGKCALCLRSDCGICTSCRTNKESTQVVRQCCMLKVCLRLGKRRTKQIPGFPKGWKYFFDDPASSSKGKPLHPALHGLRVCGPNRSSIDGYRYYSFESAGKACKMAGPKIREAEKEVFANSFGLKIREAQEHPLVGQGFCHEWINFRGVTKILYGRIEKCEEDRFGDASLLFTVLFNEESRSMVPSHTTNSKIPKFLEFPERIAKAGALLFREKCCISTPPPTMGKALPLKWLVPDSVEFDTLEPDRHSGGFRRPKQTAYFRGMKFEFETRKSTIPNAGLGVFLRCTNVASAFARQELVLEEGSLIDMGIYAPLRPSDFRDGVVPLLKNFIFNSECEAWCFSANSDETGFKIYDITDDQTGHLHSAARRNLMVYVNETDGKETPTVWADHDPEGSVHYLLGHKDLGLGPYTLPLGIWSEVKIDYGAAYERVRVRKGYSRLPDAERELEEQKIENDDHETMNDIEQWSVDDVEKAMAYIDNLPFSDRPPKTPATRAIILSVRLYQRLVAVKREFASFDPQKASEGFCDNGWTTMEKKQLVPKVKSLFSKLLGLWRSSDQQLKSAFTSDDNSLFYIGQLINRNTNDMKSMTGASLRQAIEQAMGMYGSS